MSAIFRAEIANLQRVVASHEAMLRMTANEREEARCRQSAARDADDAAILTLLRQEDRPMPCSEIAVMLNFNLRRTDKALARLLAKKEITRRRGAVRRADGEGFRNSWRYRSNPQ